MGKAAGEVRVFRKYDIVIIAAALIAAAIGFVLTFSRPAGSTAEVAVDGRVVATLPLSIDARYELDGNTVVVEGGQVRIDSADCPDRFCVRHKPVSKQNEAIVCLPNRVTVTVRGGGRSDVDAITG